MAVKCDRCKAYVRYIASGTGKETVCISCASKDKDRDYSISQDMVYHCGVQKEDAAPYHPGND